MSAPKKKVKTTLENLSQCANAPFFSIRCSGEIGAREAKDGRYPMESDLVVVSSVWYQGTTSELVHHDVFGLLEKADIQKIVPASAAAKTSKSGKLCKD